MASIALLAGLLSILAGAQDSPPTVTEIPGTGWRAASNPPGFKAMELSAPADGDERQIIALLPHFGGTNWWNSGRETARAAGGSCPGGAAKFLERVSVTSSDAAPLPMSPEEVRCPLEQGGGLVEYSQGSHFGALTVSWACAQKEPQLPVAYYAYYGIDLGRSGGRRRSQLIKASYAANVSCVVTDQEGADLSRAALTDKLLPGLRSFRLFKASIAPAVPRGATQIEPSQAPESPRGVVPLLR